MHGRFFCQSREKDQHDSQGPGAGRDLKRGEKRRQLVKGPWISPCFHMAPFVPYINACIIFRLRARVPITTKA